MTSVRRADEGWTVGLEVVESHRIPSSTDMLAIYEAEMDAEGELVSYRRVEALPPRTQRRRVMRTRPRVTTAAMRRCHRQAQQQQPRGAPAVAAPTSPTSSNASSTRASSSRATSRSTCSTSSCSPSSCGWSSPPSTRPRRWASTGGSATPPSPRATPSSRRRTGASASGSRPWRAPGRALDGGRARVESRTSRTPTTRRSPRTPRSSDCRTTTPRTTPTRSRTEPEPEPRSPPARRRDGGQREVHVSDALTYVYAVDPGRRRGTARRGSPGSAGSGPARRLRATCRP